MKKRFLAFFLALVMVLALCPAALAAEGDFVIENGVLTRYKGHDDNVVIPSKVTSIGDKAFFCCESLTSVTIPNSVTSIGDNAFYSCWSLTNVTIPSSVTSIGNWAFYNCRDLTSVTIPSSMIRIGKYAFSDCTGLKSMAIPSSVTSIGWGAFAGCTSLVEFQVEAGNQIYTSVDGLLFTKDKSTLVVYPGGKQGAYTVPFGVTNIAGQAFYGCTRLTGVTIADSITSIGDLAFSQCTGLKSVTIPDGVTDIGYMTFHGCTGLTGVTIPDGVTNIGKYAFSDCTGLKSVMIPNSVTSIGYSAFTITDLKDIYYGGTEEQWKTVQIEEDNGYLISATVHYNSTMPKPAEPEKPVAHPNTVPVTIDGKTQEFQMYSLKDAKGNDTNYIKIRDLALALKDTAAGFNVDSVNGVITFTSGADYKPNGWENKTPYSGQQTYTKNSGNINVNGTLYRIDAFQITCNGGGYTYFQLKDVAQKLNFNVAWRGGIVVETDKPYSGE